MQRFCLGQFDAEVTENVAHTDPNLSVQLFRFLHMFGVNIEVPPPVSVAKMQRELTQVALGSEEKDLKWQEAKLKAEVAKLNECNENMLQWQCRTEVAKHANITQIERNRSVLIDAQQDMRLPCSEITTESALGGPFAKLCPSMGRDRR